jgi:predicted Zn-dependent peptidase
MTARSGTGVVKEILPNGLKVIIEPLREFSSVSMGIWVLTGSRDEEISQSGISHFIEHLAFKGTSRRTARQIALEIDSFGGSLNAFTSKEFTSFYARVLGENLSQSMDLLADITLNSVFAAEELSKERDVILQEISMVEDTPDDIIHDLHCQEFWADQSLGRPILGTQSSLLSVERDHVLDFHAKQYCAGQMILTASGALEPDRFLREAREAFGNLVKGDPPAKRGPTRATPGICVKNRPVEQVHCCIGHEGSAADDERRYVMYLLNSVLGGGMSSRLFQKIREEYGLAYSVYSYHSAYQDTGIHTIYCGTSVEGFPKSLEIIREETHRLAEEKILDVELATCKRQLKGNLLLGLESTGNRMNQLARNEIYTGRHVTPEEIGERIEAVTVEDIRDLASTLFQKKNSAMTVIGPVSEAEVHEIAG